MKQLNYQCFNSEFRNKNIVDGCPYCDRKGHLVLEGDEMVDRECPNEGENRKVKCMGEKLFGGPVIKMTKEQIKVDRKKRSQNHFKKEIFPTLTPGTIEEKHFTKKFSK